jgi:hypothetical protein
MCVGLGVVGDGQWEMLFKGLGIVTVEYKSKSKVFRKTYHNDVAGPVASKTRLFPSPFLRESGGDGGRPPSAPNFGV